MTSVVEENALNGSLLNWEGLHARCLGRADLVEKVLGRFHESLERDVQLLERSVEQFDPDQVADWVHRLKGTAMTVSATGIQSRAEQLERLLAEGTEEQARKCLVELKTQCECLSESIAEHLGGAE